MARKLPPVDDQSESPSIRLLEKKKEATIIHQAMEEKKEVGSLSWGWEQGCRGRGLAGA